MLENGDWYELEIPKCPVCWEEIHSSIIALDCGHVFHKDCIKDWRLNIESCPNCRHKIKPKSSINLFYTLQQKVSDCYLSQTKQNMELYEMTGSSFVLQEKLAKISSNANKTRKKLQKKNDEYNQLSNDTKSLMNLNQQIKKRILDLKIINEKQDAKLKAQIQNMLILKEKIQASKNKKAYQEKATQDLIQKNQILYDQIQKDQTRNFDYNKLNDENVMDQLKENVVKLTIEVNKQYIQKIQFKKDIEELQKSKDKRENQINTQIEENKTLRKQLKTMERILNEKIRKQKKKISKRGKIINKFELTNLNKQIFHKYTYHTIRQLITMLKSFQLEYRNNSIQFTLGIGKDIQIKIQQKFY